MSVCYLYLHHECKKELCCLFEQMSYIQKGKKPKPGSAPINFIDVSADDLRPETQDWLKAVSAEVML